MFCSVLLKRIKETKLLEGGDFLKSKHGLNSGAGHRNSGKEEKNA
jgi:hypothetical protein